jgi:chemotaxis protein methyltransferase CheR
MTVTVDEVERFSELVAAGLGLRMSDRPVNVLSAVLSRRAELCGTSTGRYLDWLAAGPEEDELGRLAGSLTVPETYFFRDPDQLRAFVDLARALGGSRVLRILSAGCASGEEPYSLAMLLRDGGFADFSILGVDINPELIACAAQGQYSAWALRATPAEKRQRWFDADNVLSEEIRTAVRFETHNLAGPDTGLWRPDTYDVIFCRNVLMYLTEDGVTAVVDRLASALVPGGRLFVAPAENARVRHPELRVRQADGCFSFERETPSASRASPVVRPAREQPRPAGPEQALHFIRSERFAEALDVVLALPDSLRTAPAVLVLEAVLRAACDDFTAAERICGDLLDRDKGNADAQYVIATCCAGRADPAGAEQAIARVVELDAYFAIPRLHLGMLAARRGDRPMARRELSRALDLLPWESAERVLLFGGGFTVDGLSAICRTHLTACGEAP